MIRYLFLFVFVFSASASFAENASEAELIAFGQEIKDLIKRDDVEGLKRYFKYGVSTPNDYYTRDEVYRKLDDKFSWLYKRFFVGIGSAKAFFQRNESTDVELSGSCDYAIVSYVSSDGREKYDCYFSVFKKNKKIFIGELPPCPSL